MSNWPNPMIARSKQSRPEHHGGSERIDQSYLDNAEHVHTRWLVYGARMARVRDTLPHTYEWSSVII
jgi:hypothetical protein